MSDVDPKKIHTDLSTYRRESRDTIDYSNLRPNMHEYRNPIFTNNTKADVTTAFLFDNNGHILGKWVGVIQHDISHNGMVHHIHTKTSNISVTGGILIQISAGDGK